VNLSRLNLLLVGAPAALASVAVLALSGVSTGIWAIQATSICLACAIALIGTTPFQREGGPSPAGLIIGGTLAGLVVPLVTSAPGPDRWLSIGPLSLYVAPVVLPAFLIACSVWLAGTGRSAYVASAAVVAASLLLALQPDAAQALALLVAIAVAGVRSRSKASIGAVVGAGIFTAWAFSQPDPLQPVPYVEGVFALAFGHSVFTGVAVAAGGAALVVGLYANSSRGRNWLSAVAAYYAVLFTCSIAGLTPAPLVGYGAGPILGFGLMVAAASLIEMPPNNGIDTDKPRQ